MKTPPANPKRGSLTPTPGSGEYPRLLGGRLCLDFANTIEDARSAAPQEFLLDARDLAGWGRHAGILSPAEAGGMRGFAAARPDDAAAAFARALAVRGAIVRTFDAIADGDEPEAGDLAALAAAYADGLAHARLAPAGPAFDWRWPAGDGAPERVGWEAARSAIELLRSVEPGRIRRCPGPDGQCGWLFYDDSRNGSRRWCSMEGCGSQTKMRRYRAKDRADRAQ